MMENYKVGDLKRYGLDYETIKALNPGIIYCSVTGFGQTGPYAPRAGYDAILQAMGGLMSVTGHIDGEPGEGPMKVGPSIVDYMTGMNTSIGILSALYHRDANNGEGQHIDVCLFDTVIASLSHWLQIYLVNGTMPPRRGTWGNGGMPAGVFRCTDGELMLVVGNDGQFQRTCAVLGEPELANDKRFVKNNDRVVHGKEIMAIFAGLFPEAEGRLLAGEARGGRRAVRPDQQFRAGVQRPARPVARHARQGRPSVRARPVADPQRADLLGHPHHRLPRPRRCSAPTPRTCWRRSATTKPRWKGCRHRGSSDAGSRSHALRPFPVIPMSGLLAASRRMNRPQPGPSTLRDGRFAGLLRVTGSDSTDPCIIAITLRSASKHAGRNGRHEHAARHPARRPAPRRRQAALHRRVGRGAAIEAESAAPPEPLILRLPNPMSGSGEPRTSMR